MILVSHSGYLLRKYFNIGGYENEQEDDGYRVAPDDHYYRSDFKASNGGAFY